MFSIFDLFDLDTQKVVDFFAKLHITISGDMVENGSTILILLAIIYFIYKMVVGIVKTWKSFIPKRKWRHKYIQNGLAHLYGDYLTTERQRCYIPTQCQGTPPHNFEEPDEAVASSPKEELVKFFLDSVFKASNTNRMLYCILAGSGMGKTTFAVQLFVEYINKYKESTLPYDIYIRDLGEAKVIDEIQALSARIGEHAHKSILLLDALDENLQASENFVEFKGKLEEVIAPFKFVVITCRSQFFPSDEAIPDSSNIRLNTTNKNFLSYNKIYICPFSEDDIRLYINKKYKGIGKKKRRLRKQAVAIIEKCRHLMARPVLLSYIDDLLDVNTEYTTEFEIYETLIDKWLQREVNNIPDAEERSLRYRQLIVFSQKLAVQMYQNWRETGDFRLDSYQMDDFSKKNSFDKDTYQFRRRSLINHDANGAFKFSHKSFLEYFLAFHYFENPEFDFSFEGMDMAELFYKGCCLREYRNRPSDVFKIITISNNEFLTYAENTLVVTRRCNYDLTHLFYVIDPESFSELELDWRAYDTNVQAFIEESGINTIIITNYRKGDGGIRQILKGSDLEFISIEGDVLPNTFIKEARKKGVYVMFNDQTILRGNTPSFNTTLSFQLKLQIEKQLNLMQKERLTDGRKYMEDLYNQPTKDKGGEL